MSRLPSPPPPPPIKGQNQPQPADWYALIDGQQMGPMTFAQLKSMADHIQLRRDDLIWKTGMSDWQPASSVGGLFSTSAGRAIGSSATPSPPTTPKTSPKPPSSSQQSAVFAQSSPNRPKKSSAINSRGRIAFWATIAWLFVGIMLTSLVIANLGADRFGFGFKVLIWGSLTLVYFLMLGKLYLEDQTLWVIDRVKQAFKQASPLRLAIAGGLLLAAFLLHVTILDWDFGKLEYGPDFNLESRKVIGISVPIKELSPQYTRYYGVVIPGPLIHRGNDILLGLVSPVMCVVAVPFVLIIKV